MATIRRAPDDMLHIELLRPGDTLWDGSVTTGELASHLEQLGWIVALGGAVADREDALRDRARGLTSHRDSSKPIIDVADAGGRHQRLEEVRYGSPIEVVIPIVYTIGASVPGLVAILYATKRIYGFPIELRSHLTNLEVEYREARLRLAQAESRLEQGAELEGVLLEALRSTRLPDNPSLLTPEELELLETRLREKALTKAWVGEGALMSPDDRS